MIVRDALGNQLNEKDLVSYALGSGQLAVGQIVSIDIGLDNLGPHARPPVVVIQIQLPLPASPNGMVGGILKTLTPAPAVDPSMN